MEELRAQETILNYLSELYNTKDLDLICEIAGYNHRQISESAGRKKFEHFIEWIRKNSGEEELNRVIDLLSVIELVRLSIKYNCLEHVIKKLPTESVKRPLESIERYVLRIVRNLKQEQGELEHLIDQLDEIFPDSIGNQHYLEKARKRSILNRHIA